MITSWTLSLFMIKRRHFLKDPCRQRVLLEDPEMRTYNQIHIYADRILNSFTIQDPEKILPERPLLS